MKAVKSSIPYGYYVSKGKDELKKELEQKRLEILIELDKALLELHNLIGFKVAIIFGSVVKKHQFLEDSDIDLAFEGLHSDDYFKAMALISERLHRDVEIIQLEKHCRFKEKIIESGIKWQKI